MLWSHSSGRTFQNCQRQWYFRNCLAHHASKDTLRREAYLLSKLQSVSAWRGSIVDFVISSNVIPALRKGWVVSKSRIISYAQEVFAEQLEFARNHRLREPGMKVTKVGRKFAALYAVEYSELDDEDIEQAWTDIEKALDNLLQMNELLDKLKAAEYIVTQRALQFQHYKMSVRAVPDLMAFYRRGSPLIVDWKVHTFGTADYRTQLGIYAIALSNCKAHKDFPKMLSTYAPTDIHLWEVQLLTSECRKYLMSHSDVADIESYIAKSMEQILLVVGESDNKELTPFDFDVAYNPDSCSHCPFRKICWEELP